MSFYIRYWLKKSAMAVAAGLILGYLLMAPSPILLPVLTGSQWGTGVAAADEGEVKNDRTEPQKAPGGAVDSHASHLRFYFQDVEMDFIFGSLILGATVNHGCEIGEAFYTAARIQDGDAASWREEWLKTARLVEARGEQALARGHTVSAREQLQRASYYYRAVLLPMPPDDPRFKEIALKSRALLRQAGSLLAPQLEYIEVPFEGTVLPGYFRKAAPGETPRKTLIMVGGAETFSEDLFFYIAYQAYDRGYNFLDEVFQ